MNISAYFGHIYGKIMKIFNSDNQHIKEKMKYFFQKHLAEIKKGCIFALANDKKRVLGKMVR